MSEFKMGHLVVLEGNERTGKTTQLHRVATALEAKGYEVVVTREPGGTPFAETLRSMILDNSDNKDLDPVTELLLFAAGRQDHNVKVIKPALDAGKVVLCSRNFFSTFALQVHPYGSDELLSLFNHVTGVNMGVLGDHRPVMVNLLLTHEQREARLLANPPADAIERRDSTYQDFVTEAYGLLETQPGVINIDASEAPEVITEKIVAELELNFADQINRVKAEAEMANASEVIKEATAVGEEPNDEVDSPETEVTVGPEEIQQELHQEIEKHVTHLEGLFRDSFTEAELTEWEFHKSNLGRWVDTHINELSEKQQQMSAEEAAHHVNQLSNNIGAMLGSWVSLKNINQMVNAS